MTDKGEYLGDYDEFKVYAFENKVALWLGSNRYAVMERETFEDWAQGWLEKYAEFYGRSVENHEKD